MNLSVFTFLLINVLFFLKPVNEPKVGDVIDSLHNIPIYYNSKDFTHVSGRNLTDDGYNLGLKYQCVEFVKRYYYRIYNHKMPISSGHAKDFFNDVLDDRAYNRKRGLMQYRNVRNFKPQVGDILVYGKQPGNSFGHIGIIGEVNENSITLYQQNMGLKTRAVLKLVEYQGIFTIADYNIKGWLRKE